MNAINQRLLPKCWWLTDIFQMSVIDKYFSRNVGHWQTFLKKCWSLTNIFREMLVIDRHFSRNVGLPRKQRQPTGYADTQNSMPGEDAQAKPDPHFPRQNIHRGEKKCSTWLSFISGQMNIIDQHLEQKCWSLTGIFQEMLGNRGSENRRGLIERRVRPTKE